MIGGMEVDIEVDSTNARSMSRSIPLMRGLLAVKMEKTVIVVAKFLFRLKTRWFLDGFL